MRSTSQRGTLPVELRYQRSLFGTYAGSPLWSLHCVPPIWPCLLKDCKLEVSTDASDASWGIYFQGQMHQGLWTSVADAPVHINAKELMALHIFLRDFLPLCNAPLSLL